MLILKPAIGVVASYLTYSFLQRKHVNQNVFPPMELLASYQQPYRNTTLITDIVQTKFSRKLPIEELSFLKNPKTKQNIDHSTSWIHIAGDELHYENVESMSLHTTKSGKYACLIAESREVSHDGNSLSVRTALFGKKSISTKSLKQLVGEKTKYLSIEENIYKRANWNTQINRCVPLVYNNVDNNVSGSETIRPAPDGSYRFCYRDYVNHEEIIGMLCRRWSIERLLFTPSVAAEIEFNDSDGNCQLKERGKLFGFIPIAIDWYGRIVHSNNNDDLTTNTSNETSIRWDTTKLKFGWTNLRRFKFLGTTIDKPSAAEKLRVDKWNIMVSHEDDSKSDILCFMREGKGHLIFAKEKCLKEVTTKLVPLTRPAFVKRQNKKQQEAIAN